MQRINRGVEIAVFLLQPCELGFEFALIFVGHGLLSQNADEICENSGKPSAADTGPATILPGSPLRKRVPLRLTGGLEGTRWRGVRINAGACRPSNAKVPIAVRRRPFSRGGNGYPAVAKGLRASHSRFVTDAGEI